MFAHMGMHRCLFISMQALPFCDTVAEWTKPLLPIAHCQHLGIHNRTHATVKFGAAAVSVQLHPKLHEWDCQHGDALNTCAPLCGQTWPSHRHMLKYACVNEAYRKKRCVEIAGKMIAPSCFILLVNKAAWDSLQIYQTFILGPVSVSAGNVFFRHCHGSISLGIVIDSRYTSLANF